MPTRRLYLDLSLARLEVVLGMGLLRFTREQWMGAASVHPVIPRGAE